MGLRRRKITFGILLVVEPDDDRYHAFCPALKGLHADGNTVEEARKNAQDAVIAYLRSLIKHNDPIPLGVLNYTAKEEEGEKHKLPQTTHPTTFQHQVTV